MALTTLTPVATWDDVKVPDNGTKMVAVSATDPPPNDEGPVRQAFQQLANRGKWLRDKILAGTRTFKALVIDYIDQRYGSGAKAAEVVTAAE